MAGSTTTDWKKAAGAASWSWKNGEYQIRDATPASAIRQSARQRMMLDEDDEEKWYRGDMPTTREALARIYTIGQQDPQQGESLYNAWAYYQSDPSTPFYNPYSRATNRAIDEIAALGVDTSGGIGSDWLQRNAALMNDYRTGTGTSPLAPSSKSTAEQDRAYWYYKIYDAEETTQKAETEWAALKEEIAYWVGRSDRNYSDDEILSRIDWSQYKTLTAMDEARQKGTPMTLNRAIGYSQDALYGAIWAARNGGGTGDSLIDSVKYTLGDGNQWQENEDISRRLDPTSPDYSPYSVGATLDDAAEYFGVDSFDQTWLDSNRDCIDSRDKTRRTMYGKVYDAEQITQQAEADLKQLNDRVEYWLGYTDDADMILDGLLDDFFGDPALTTLKKMDESRRSGDLLATTRAIDYRWEDVEAEVRRRCAAKAEAKKGSEYVAGVTGTLGAGASPATDSQTAIDGARDSAVSAAGATIMATGTDAEKGVWQNAYSADFDTYLVQISEALQRGVTDPQGGYDYCLERANGYAGARYIQARESGDEQTLASIRRSYEIADRMAALTGATPGDTQSAMSALDYAYQYGRDYVPTNWTAYSVYDVALEQGSSIEEVRAAAKQGAQETQAEIARIDEALAYIDSHSIVLDRTYMDNMKRERDRLERCLKDAEYFELSGSEDFEQVSQETSQKISKAWGGFSLLPTIMGRDGYSELDYAMTDTAAAIRSDTLVPYMTDIEKSTYLYILGTQGKEAAREYYDHLANEAYGVLQTRQTQTGTAFWQAFTQEHPLAGNALAVVASPMQAAGGLYSVKAKLAGQEINPNASAFAATHMSAAIRGTSKEMITQEFGEGTAANFLANLGYDAVTSSADSLVSAYLGGGSTLASVAIMSSGAGSAAIADAKERGATDTQALLLGGCNFLAEMVTEYLPMDQLLKLGDVPPQTFREFIKAAGKQALSEGTEELVSGIIETVSDDAIMGRLSNLSIAVQAYAAQGMTPEEATAAAMKDATADILYGAAAGAVSGGLSATAQTAMNLPGRRRQQNTQTQETSPEGQNGPSEPAQTGTEEASTEAPAGNEETQQTGTEGEEGHPGTEEAPAGNEETQQTGTEGAEAQRPNEAPQEAPPALSEEEVGLLARQQAALAQALATEDTASRTATLAGVLAAKGGDFEATSAASAAAQHVMTQYGSQTAIERTREILLTAAEMHMSGETLRAALHTAALGEGASAAVLSQIMTEGPSTQLLGALADAASEDVSSPAVQETIRKAVTDNQIATRVKALIADGALSGLRSYEEGVTKARGELRTAQKGFSTAANDYRVAGENMESLFAQWTQNPSDAALDGRMQQAVKDVGGKAIVVEQYRQSVANAQEKVAQAQKALAAVREETMKRIREQAQQEVMQAKEQARAEREAAQQQTPTQTALFDRMPDREFTPVTMPETDVWQYIDGNRLKRGDILRDVFAALTGRNPKSPYGGIVVNNADTGLDIHIGEKSVRHGLNRNNATSQRGIMAAFALDDVVKSAVQVGRGTPRAGKADARVMLSAVTDGKLVYPVTLLVEQIQGGGMEVVGTEALPGIDRQQLYSYSVKRGIKTEPAVPRTDAAETGSLTSTGSGISIAKLYEAVKGELAKTVEGFREGENSPANPTQGQTVTQTPHAENQPLGNVQNANISPANSMMAQGQTAVNNGVSDSGGNDAGNIQANKAAPVSPQPGQSSGPIKSGDQIRMELAQALGMPADPRKKKYLRSARKNTLGYTRIGRKIVHVQDAGDVETIAHEYGHKFDEEFGLRKIAPVKDMIAKMESDPKQAAWLMQYSDGEKAGEVIAEFAKYWLLDRDSAIAFGGKEFTEKWEKLLDSKGYLKPMQDAGQDLRLNRAATAGERAKAAIDLTDRKPIIPFKEKLKGMATAIADYTLPTEELTRARRKAQGKNFDASRDVRTLLLAKENMVASMTDSCLYDTMVDPEGNVVLDKDGQALGSLKDILQDIPKKYEKAFNALWASLHAQNRQVMDKAVFSREINPYEAARRLEAEHPEFRAVIDRAEAWYTKFMQTWLVDTGLMPQEDFDNLRELYPYYIPTFRSDTEFTEQYAGILKASASPGNGVKTAVGATTNLYNPVMGMVEYIQRYIANYKHVEVLRAFDETMLRIPGLESIAEPAQKDIGSENRTAANEQAFKTVKDLYMAQFASEGKIKDEEMAKRVLEALAKLPEEGYWVKKTASGEDVLNIPLPGGEIASWTVYNKDILNAMLHMPPKRIRTALRAIGNCIGQLTRFLSSMATGRSVTFGVQNYASDTETAMITGHGAGNWLTFIPQQIASMCSYLNDAIREVRGLETSEMYRQFQLFGQMGSRYAFRDKKTQKQTRNALYGKKDTLTRLRDKIAYSPLAPIEAFTGFLEDSTRYNEFRHSRGESDTYSDRLQSGENAHNVTVNFSMHGSSEALVLARIVKPFFNAQVQGLYKTARMFSNANEGERAKIAGRLLMSCVMKTLVFAALRNLTWKDDEKEAYDQLSAYEKNKYEHFKIGDGKFIRIKRSQDAIIQAADAIGEFLGNTMTGYEGDAWGDLVAASKEIALNMAITADTVFTPVMDALNNRTWYGGAIEDYNMQGLPTTARYKAETPKIYRWFSGLLNTAGAKLSPLDVEYIVSQYTGSLGVVGSGILGLGTEGKLTAEGILGVVRDRLADRFSVDSVYTNAITSAFYDGKTRFEEMLNEVEDYGRPATYLRDNLTQEEANAAAAEAKALMSKGGALYEINNQAKDLWAEHDAILVSDTMTDAQKEQAAREVRRQINALLLEGNTVMGDFWAKYGYGNEIRQNMSNFLDLFTGSKEVPKLPTAYDLMPQTFADDIDLPYMQQAKAVYEATGEAKALPHPLYEFSENKVKYVVEDEYADEFASHYKMAYQKYLVGNSKGWDALTDEERLEILGKAHENGHAAAKAWYIKHKKSR